MSDEDRASFAEFDRRLKLLENAAEPAEGAERTSDEEPGMKFGDGLQVGIELVVGVGMGAAIGWATDQYFETTPLFILVFFFLGAGAGMRNAVRHLHRIGMFGEDEAQGARERDAGPKR